MLRNAADAEDIVQDVWLLWQSTDRSAVENPYAFLATTTRRLCINVAQSARSLRHETCCETWCFEQVDTSTDPGLGAERGEALWLAVLIILEETHARSKRAAYILREAFDYPYRQIANILQMEEANTRQLVSRARKHIADDRRQPVSSDEQRRLVDVFCRCRAPGKHDRSGTSLRGECCLFSDNGGITREYVRVSGRKRVARFIAIKVESSRLLPTAGVSSAIDMQHLTRYLLRLCQVENSMDDVLYGHHFSHRLQSLREFLGVMVVHWCVHNARSHGVEADTFFCILNCETSRHSIQASFVIIETEPLSPAFG